MDERINMSCTLKIYQPKPIYIFNLSDHKIHDEANYYLKRNIDSRLAFLVKLLYNGETF